MFRSWQAMAMCVLEESRSMSYSVVFSTTWWLLENNKPSAVWTMMDMILWIIHFSILLLETGLHTHTHLLSCLEVDTLVGSTAHHANIWTLSWEKQATEVNFIGVQDSPSHSPVRAPIVTSSSCIYQWTLQPWSKPSGHSRSAPDCSSSPSWRCGLAGPCWLMPTASHLTQQG